MIDQIRSNGMLVVVFVSEYRITTSSYFSRSSLVLHLFSHLTTALLIVSFTSLLGLREGRSACLTDRKEFIINVVMSGNQRENMHCLVAILSMNGQTDELHTDDNVVSDSSSECSVQCSEDGDPVFTSQSIPMSRHLDGVTEQISVTPTLASASRMLIAKTSHI